MANFALNYSFSRNLNIPLDEDAVKVLRSDVVTYVKTKSKCYAGQLFSVTGDTVENNGLYVALKTGEDGSVIKLASQDALDAIAESAGKIDVIQLNGSALTINDKTVNIDLSDYVTNSDIDSKLESYATKSEVTEQIVSAMTGGEIELTGYAKIEYVDDLISSAKTEVSEYTDSKISGLSEVYATKDDLDKFQSSSEETIDEKISGLSEVYAQKEVLETLVGEDSGKTARDIASEEIAKIVASADSSFDTLKEIADWITNDTEGAASMANDIAELKSFSADTRLESLETSAHTHGNKDIIDGISAEQVSAWDSAVSISAEIKGVSEDHESRIDVLEGLKHNHTNKDVIDAISAEQVSAWDGAVSLQHGHENKDVIDGISAEQVSAWDSAASKEHEHANKEVIDGISAEQVSAWDSAVSMTSELKGVSDDHEERISNLEVSAHTHENKEVIDGISAEKVSAWDEAESKAKEYADGLSVNYDAAGSAASALTEALEYTDTKVSGLSEVYATIESVNEAKEEIISASTKYVDDKLVDYATKSEVTEQIVSAMTGGEIELTGYAKVEDVKDMISSAKTEVSEYTDSKISGLSEVYASKELVETIVGEDSGKTAREIVSEEISKVVAGADASYDTLKEIADWILNDTTGAASMANDIEDLKSISADTRLEALENVKELEGGIATEIDENKKINVKVSESEGNFLEVNDSNELEVKEITLDAAKTSKDIVVEGGQWADAVKTVYGSSVPAGTTWESFLEAMLCVEKFAGSITTSTAFTVSCGNINPGIDKSGTVEVGTKVTLGETIANSTTASQSLTAKTFTYGYKLGEDGSHNSSSAYTETLTPSKTESNDALKITFSNFKDAVNDGSAIEEKTGNGSIDSVEMYAMEGTNKVTVYQTGDTYTSSSAVTAGTIYVATNLKNYYKSDKSTPNTYTPSFVVTSKTASDSTEYTVTGAHKYFIGDVTDYSDDYWNDDRSEVIRGLDTTGWATGSTISKVEHTFKVGTKQQTVVIPSAYNSVSAVDANNGTVTFNFVKEIDFTNAQGYISKYKVYVAPSKDGLSVDSKIIITISK